MVWFGSNGFGNLKLILLNQTLRNLNDLSLDNGDVSNFLPREQMKGLEST